MPKRLGVAVAAILALPGGAIGCGSDDEGPAPTDYESALESVDADAAEAGFEWVDRARLAELTGLDPSELADPAAKAFADDEVPGRFSAPPALATGPLLNLAGQGDAAVGFDPSTAPSSVYAGVVPDAAVRFDGLDADAIADQLREAGYEAGSSDERLQLGEPGQPIITGPLGRYGLVGANRVAFGADWVAFGATDDALAAVEPNDDRSSLLDEPVGQALSSCLDDPVAVMQSSGEGTALEGVLAAVAVAIPAFDDPHAAVQEQICAITPDAAEAPALADQVEKGLGPDAVNPITNVPFPEEIGTVAVEDSESGDLGVVSATVTPPEDRVGVLFRLYQQSALSAAFGAGDITDLRNDRDSPPN